MTRMEPWKRIWLQVDEPEVSWCQDKIHDSDVEYVSLSAIRAMVEEVRAAHDVDPEEGGWARIILDDLLARLEK